MLLHIHHVAIICSDYQTSRQFYTEVLGLTVKAETYREDRQSYKLDLALNDSYIIELFSFLSPPKRLSRPEATGLRHLAFAVSDINKVHDYIRSKTLQPENIRIDEITGKHFFFITDPDGLPIEFYEV